MKHSFFLMLMLTMSASCARLPQLLPGNPLDPDPTTLLRSVFPAGRWQLTHSIDASVMGETKSGLIGISVLSSSDHSLRCVLMTIEGFVLFAGRFDGELVVERALPPFDRPGFARGLIDDLLLLFFPPDGPILGVGDLSDGERVLRFGASTGAIIDVILHQNGGWAIRKYGSNHRLERSIEAWDDRPAGSGFIGAHRMVLEREGLTGYQLDLRLLQGVALP